MPLNVKLVVVGGDAKTTEISLKLPSIVGRGRGLAVVLPHPLVSRQHCELFESDGRLMVRDLGSLNGTFVNNEKITESILGPDELLTIGTVTFRAVYKVASGKAAAASTLKKKPPEKTVKVATGATKAAAKAPAPKQATQDSSGPLDFDFDESRATIMQPPSASADDSELKTEQLVAIKPDKKQPAAGSSKGEKKAATPPPSDSESSDSEFDKPMSSSSDDDLNDFLDSLKDK